MAEVQRDDGRSELVLLVDEAKSSNSSSGGRGDGGADGGGGENDEEADLADARPGIVNSVPVNVKIDLSRKRLTLDKSDKYLEWLAKDTEIYTRHYHSKKKKGDDVPAQDGEPTTKADINDYRANYVEPPLLPSEKRRLYFGPETPVLAPLTTVGNLPFRRLCVELGAQLTYSEMALGMPLLQGQKADWTLMRAHECEVSPPRFNPYPGSSIVQDYSPTHDLRFGAQIAANTPWVAIRATEALARFLPHLRLIDLNCGCPVDAVYKTGAGSALLDAPSKLERMIRGMNTVSGEVPITAKIRVGVRDDRPTALKTVERLGLGGEDMRDLLGAPGCAAVTLHGRTRQQRYTRAADWGYIAECAAVVKRFREAAAEVADTAREPDARTLPANGSTDKATRDSGVGAATHMYFIGNGDVFSHEDYYSRLSQSGVDAIMIGRGALVKPWIFEEIERGQYLDKSALERLDYVARFARYGMEAWGSDELGLNFTRRFLLEFLSFFHRYVPVGLLEHLPPSLNDRPPAYRGRSDLETLLASPNYKDWIKIR
jgi:tRNA-dihydrouridine synthase 3